MLTSEELEWFRDRAKRSEPTNLNNQALGRIVAEVDRLRSQVEFLQKAEKAAHLVIDHFREGVRLAKEWLRRSDLRMKEEQARESFRAWADKEAGT